MFTKSVLIFAGAAFIAGLTVRAEQPLLSGVYAKWTNGPSPAENFFPIAVWLQPPERAKEYLAAGFNTYVGLWQGPTEEQLAKLKQAGMKVVCEQNAVGLKHLNDPTVIGWMHGDEPDNAQSWGARLGWSAPVPPGKVVQGYQKTRAADPSRPVMVNLGQGVAWDNWIGRGSRNHHPEDYPEYLKGCDIVSFDIYPVVHRSPAVSGNLFYVARGVERLVKWAGPERIVWNCIECTHIQNLQAKATPQQVRAEVWMSLIHGSRGLIYFVHEWKPKFNESALLDDANMLAAVKTLNQQITRLAPVLNCPNLKDVVAVSSGNKDIPIATMVKHGDGALYLFAAAMRNDKTTATFTVKGLTGEQSVKILDENRTLTAKDGGFADNFEPWAAHIYRIKTAP